VKYEPGYGVFDDGLAKNLFCKTEAGNVYIGQVWPGRTAFPDFSKPATRAWWGELNAKHIGSGIAGIWNDMNEPATGQVEPFSMRFDRDGENHPHERFHNQYGLLMAMGTDQGLLAAEPSLRTFILSRAGFSGIQRYAAQWLGDNCADWSHIAMSIPMTAGMGVSGQAFIGGDIPGFTSSPSAELAARWTQYGALTPFCRYHSERGESDKYPWSFGPGTEQLARAALQLRYRLLPYIYSAFVNSSETGAPIQRPRKSLSSDCRPACRPWVRPTPVSNSGSIFKTNRASASKGQRPTCGPVVARARLPCDRPNTSICGCSARSAQRQGMPKVC